MKRMLFFLVILAFSISITNSTLLSADRNFSTLPDNQLTEDEANLRIKEYEAKVADLQSQLTKLDENAAKLKKDIEQAIADYKSCMDALYAKLEANENDIANFRQKLGVIKGKVRSLKGLSNEALNEKQAEINDLENQLNELRKIKISVMSEFYDDIIATAKDIRELRRRAESAIVTKKYIVRTWAIHHDCLWNISKNPEIYSDPLLWPKIWQANTNIIHNPDLIHPGDELIIPKHGPKSDDELKAERKYWRRKASMINRTPDEEKKGN
jgi:nucleoid-associated protein YgaU